MKNYLFVFILFLSFSQITYGQYNKDEIEIHKAFGGNKYSVGSNSLSLKQMKILMQYDDSAFAQFKSGRSHSIAATVLGATGGVLIGINVGFAIANSAQNNPYKEDTKWGMAIAGGVLVLISIPVSIVGKKRVNNAINIYNANLTTQSYQRLKPEFRIGFTGSGIGLILKI